MPLFVSDKKLNKMIQASTLKQIQASLEGDISRIELESLLTGEKFTTSIPGTNNSYQNYAAQVRETYRKYNGRSDFGVAQTRAVVDLRTAMISGEGISVASEDTDLADWIEKFLTFNNLLNGAQLGKAVKGTEMTGQSILTLKVEELEGKEEEKSIKIMRLGYDPNRPFRVRYADDIYSNTDIVRVEIKKSKDSDWETLNIKNYTYIRTGGDDLNTEEPTTRVGVVLTDIENYDRAIKDMRRNNHIFARITPAFEVQSESDAKSLKRTLNALKWKIGEVFIGKAKFKYETPQTGAHDNLKTELAATIKNISSTTGVPVHWMGFVDLMSNRSTADSLYEMLKNATVIERTEWESALYSLILKAQELYIDSGGTDLKFSKDFSVKLPLLDYTRFKEMIDGLSKARSDGAISIDDYMNFIPGINPLKTKSAIEAENKKAEMTLLNDSRTDRLKTDKDLIDNSSKED